VVFFSKSLLLTFVAFQCALADSVHELTIEILLLTRLCSLTTTNRTHLKGKVLHLFVGKDSRLEESPMVRMLLCCDAFVIVIADASQITNNSNIHKACEKRT
jgi:hypothetical protein